MFNELYHHFENYEFFIPCSLGFARKQDSEVHEFLQHILAAVERLQLAVNIFCDPSKAFGGVN